MSPLAASHQLQLPVLVDGEERFEGEPSGPSHHALLLLEQDIQLLASSDLHLPIHLLFLPLLFLLSVPVRRLGPLGDAAAAARLQLLHEAVVDVLALDVAARVQASGGATVDCWDLVLVLSVERVGGPHCAAANQPRVRPVDEDITGVAAVRLLRRNQAGGLIFNLVY